MLAGRGGDAGQEGRLAAIVLFGRSGGEFPALIPSFLVFVNMELWQCLRSFKNMHKSLTRVA